MDAIFLQKVALKINLYNFLLSVLLTSVQKNSLQSISWDVDYGQVTLALVPVWNMRQVENELQEHTSD